MRHAIARYLFIAGVVASLGLAACSTSGNTPLSTGYPNGVGGTNGVITGTTNPSNPGLVYATTSPSPSPSHT